MPVAAETAPLTACVDALKLHLQRYFPPNQFSFGIFPEQATPAVWAELTRRLPAIGLSWGGFKVDAQSGNDLAGECLWGLTLLTKHSDIGKRYSGDVNTPGLLDMVWIAATALQAHRLLTPDREHLGTVAVTGVGNAYAAGWGGDQIALAVVNFSTPLPTAGEAFNEGLADFLTLGVTWSFPGTQPVQDEFGRAS